MQLPRCQLLKIAGLGLSSIAMPSWSRATDIMQWETDIPHKFPVKLSSNENPYGPSEQAQKAMHAQIASGNRYPNGNTRAGALASLKDQQFVNSCLIKNRDVKAYTIKELKQLKIPCIVSHTNFIYFSLANYPHDYFEKLKLSNIPGTKIYEENGKWTRITVGTDSEMKYFIQSLQYR